jgi:uncharacterized damage-inducible protein DinB
MTISQMLLCEFDSEMANTRKTLERVPSGKLTWKPHEKSMAMGRLAGHIAEMLNWAKLTMEADSFDIAPVGAPAFQPFTPASTAEILAAFDGALAPLREAIASAGDDHFLKQWTLLQGGATLMAMPRFACVRGMILNHIIHHRAQLGVYLRLNDIPVPAVYGPSADES